MHSIKARLFFVFLTCTCLSFAGAKTSIAGKVKFPAEDPTFTVEFRAGWTYEPDKDGNLDCDPGDDSGYVFSILLLKDIQSAKARVIPALRSELSDLSSNVGDHFVADLFGAQFGSDGAGGFEQRRFVVDKAERGLAQARARGDVVLA